VEVRDLRILGYEETLCFLKETLVKRIANEVPDTLILVEHYPVVTFGRFWDKKNVIDKQYFRIKKVPFLFTSRGGKVTYHAPGQLVIYPVIDLKDKKRDIAFYIDFLEKVIAKSLNRLGVPAARVKGKRGVWVSEKKIAFIGISLKNWVTYHGAAVNINNDITAFSRINPCGEDNIKVISAAEYLGRELDIRAVKQVFTEQFIKSFEEVYLNSNEGCYRERAS